MPELHNCTNLNTPVKALLGFSTLRFAVVFFAHSPKPRLVVPVNLQKYTLTKKINCHRRKNIITVLKLNPEQLIKYV